MNNDVKQIIQEYGELINANEFQRLYHKIDRETKGKFTDVLLSCGIDPLPYFTFIPGMYAHHTEHVKHIVCHDKLKAIAYAAFSSSNLESIVISDSVEKIEQDAFIDTKLVNIDLNQVGSLGDFAFASCEHLEEVNLGRALDAIPTRCFINCGALRSLYIPNSIEMIEMCPFDGCDNLKIIHYAGTVEEWNNVYKDLDWNQGLSSDAKIQCSDGVVDVFGLVVD